MYVYVCMCVRFLGSSGGRAVNVELILVKGERISSGASSWTGEDERSTGGEEGRGKGWR